MAEQENIALIQKIYAAFGSGDIQTILNTVTANTEWVNHGPATIPYAGNFTNRIPAFFQAIGESTTGGKVSANKFIAQGANVVAIGRYTATVRGTGANIDTPVAHLFTVRDGKVTSWTGFSDSAAVAAAHTGTAASARR
jgi:ketosteroid isomerase-like protein